MLISFQKKREKEAELFRNFSDSLKSNKDQNPLKKDSSAEAPRRKKEGDGETISSYNCDAITTPSQRTGKETQSWRNAPNNQSQNGVPAEPHSGEVEDNKPEHQSQVNDNDQEPDHSYGNISMEAELLRLIKDIWDELQILRNLAEDQEDVWMQFLDREKNASRVFNYYTPTEVKCDIEEMIQEAKAVQDAFHTLLDLRQKQANIEEARYTRKQSEEARRQSEETRKQSQTIMVFTVITILFVSIFPPKAASSLIE